MVYIIKAINGCGLPLLQTQPWPSEASFGYCVPGRLHVDLTTTEACGLSPGPSRGPGPGIGSFYGCWFWDEDDLFCQHRMVSWRYSQMYSGWWLNQPISQIKTGSFGIIIPVAVRWKWKPPASFSLYSQNRLLAMQKKDEVPVSD